MGSYLTEVNFLEQIVFFFPECSVIIESVEGKKNFSDNLCHNILELYNVLVEIQLTISK